jgi:hypothetical protein
MHQSVLTKDIAMLSLKAIPSTIPFRTSTKRKSKIPSQFTLGNVALFVANLRGKTVTTHSTCVTGPSRPMLSLDFGGAPTNNINSGKRSPHPMCTLRRVRLSRDDGSERLTRRKTKGLKKALGPTVEAKKTKMLAEIDGSESDSNDCNARLFGGNNNTSHAEELDDSSYSVGDE